MSEPQTQMTDADKAKIVADELAKSAGQKDGAAAKVDAGKPGEDEVLKVLNETLKRSFTSREEAVKSLTNLNSMVGDNAIAELRKKAEDSHNFDAVVKAYAKAESKDEVSARKELLDDIAEFKAAPSQQKVTSGPTASASDDRVRALELKLQERDLLDAYPEAKSVLKEVKDLAGIYSGQDLKQIYESSNLKDMAIKATTYEKEKATKASSSVQSNSRQADFADAEMKTLLDAVKARGFDDDKARFVEAYLKKAAG